MSVQQDLRGTVSHRWLVDRGRLGEVIHSRRLGRLAEDHPAEFRQEAVKLLLEFVRSPPVQQEPQPNVWDGWRQIERPATRQDVQVAVDAIGEMDRLNRSQGNEEVRSLAVGFA